jgi:hypothetical protein
MKTIFAVAAALVAAGCTSIQVKPVDAAASFRQVCIVENPKVEVSDFLDVLRDGFDRHGIASSVVNLEGAKACDVTLTYTALRTWDLAPYLSHAELRLWRDGRQIGSATYHLNGGGGLSLAKWQGTKTKIDPVMDQLLSDRH